MQEQLPERNQGDLEYLTFQLSHPHLSEILLALSSAGSSSSKSSKRRTLCEWSSTFCSSLNIPQSTSLTACHYLDVFLHKKPETPERVLELYVAVSVCVAHKVKNGISVSPSSLRQVLGDRFSLDAIITTEKYFLEKVEWKLTIVTADDLIHTLCEKTFSGSFGKVSEIACKVAVVSYWFSEIPVQGILISAVSCILIALQKLCFHQLKSDWMRAVTELVVVDWETVFEVVERIEEKLMNFSSG